MIQNEKLIVTCSYYDTEYRHCYPI